MKGSLRKPLLASARRSWPLSMQHCAQLIDPFAVRRRRCWSGFRFPVMSSVETLESVRFGVTTTTSKPPRSSSSRLQEA
jgi:hypothetical protein